MHRRHTSKDNRLAMHARSLILLAAILGALPASAVETKEAVFEGKHHIVTTVDLDRESLQLFLRDERGVYFNNFENVDRWLAARNRRLVFAMNAGMFHPGFAPVGLFIADGRMRGILNLENGEGNFFLKPNGVFSITDTGAVISESASFGAFLQKNGIGKVKLATQSGPLLVLDGKLHPAFRAASESRLFRNGVGVVAPRRVVFAISSEPVNFHEFASLFRDGLGCENALFLDGTISSLYTGDPAKRVLRFPLGPIIGVSEEQAP